jgi:gliding motility-associated-like protein
MLIAANASGCSDTAFANITFNPSPDLGADQTTGVCAGIPANLTTGFNLNGLTASWTSGGAPVADPTQVTVGGIYQLIATNAFGCSDTALVNVTVTNGPSLGPDQSFDLCPWQTVDLSTAFNTSGLGATYTLSGLPVTNFTAVYDSGLYTVLVTDLITGCSDQAYAQVNNVECICSADFVHDAKCIQEPVTFSIVTDSILTGAHWTFGNGQPDQYVLQPTLKLNSEDSVWVKLEATMTCGTYTVIKYISAYDCSDSCHFYLPTAFTPNSDGTNDSFTWKGECTPEEFYLAIYNRFGQVVYQSDNPMASWDGKYNNTTSPSGVYVYHLEYRLPYQYKQVVSGRLNVVR